MTELEDRVVAEYQALGTQGRRHSRGRGLRIVRHEPRPDAIDERGAHATRASVVAMARSDIDALSLVKRPLDLADPMRDALLQAFASGPADPATHRSVTSPPRSTPGQIGRAHV